MKRYQQRITRYNHQTNSLSTQSNQKRLVKFRDKASTSKPRRRSMSILKVKSSYSSPRISRVKSTVNDPKSNMNQYGQQCQNQQILDKAKQQYLKYLQGISTLQNFQDKSFHQGLSISSLNQNKQQDEKIVWKRIPEIFGSKDLIMWTTNPIGSIVKGSSSCPQYLPVALNCIRNNKSLLRHIFERQVALSQGIYYVKLFINNKWQYFIIDDYIPVLEQKKGYLIHYKPVFCYFQTNRLKKQPTQIWFYLLEKALAKAYLNYQNIKKGNVSDMLTDVTGYGCNIYPMNSVHTNWRQLFKRLQVMVIGSTSKKKTIAIYKELKNSRVFFKLNNNNHERISIWPEDLKKYFIEIFTWGEFFYNYWGSCEIKETMNQNICARSFIIRQNSRCCLNLTQKDRKLFPKHSSYQYSWIRFVLFQKQFNGGYRWIGGDYNNSKVLSIETQLISGQYIAIAIPQWKNGQYPLGLVIKSSLPVKLVKQIYQEGTFQEGCADLAQRFGKFNQISRFLCSYNCYHQEMGIIIENINNQKMRGQTKIRRIITGIAESTEIYPFNKEFRQNSLQIDIKADKCYTVVLLTREGIKQDFIQQFKQNSGQNWNQSSL